MLMVMMMVMIYLMMEPTVGPRAVARDGCARASAPAAHSPPRLWLVPRRRRQPVAALVGVACGAYGACGDSRFVGVACGACGAGGVGAAAAIT